MLKSVTPANRTGSPYEMARLSLLYQVAERVNSTLELDACLDHIIDGAYRLFQAEKVSLMLIEEGTNSMRIAAARNIPADVMAAARVAVGAGLAGKVALSGEALVVTDVEDDPRFQRKSGGQYESASFAIVPLKIKDSVIGVLNLTNRTDGAPFSADDVALLTALANQAAIAIENSRLITQLNREKEQLRRSAFESDVLYQVSSAIQYGLGYQHLIEVLASRLGGLVQYDVLCSLLVLDGQEEFETHMPGPQPEGFVTGVKRRLLDELAGRPVGRLVLDRVAALRGTLAPAKEDSEAFTIMVPLEVNGQAMGMICVADREGKFTQEDGVLLRRIVERMAETVERLQNTIRGEQDKMESMVASMSEGVLMFDVNDDLVVLNPTARTMLGLSRSEEFTKDSLLHSIAATEIAEFLARPAEGEMAEREFTVEGQPDGRTLVVAMTPVTDERNARLGRVAVIRDVTLQRELDRMKSDFVAVVSHELRTPLSSIKMFISNLIDGVEGPLAEGQRETLLRVTKNVDRLSRLITDLLDLSKLEAGKMQLRLQPMDVAQTLRSVADGFVPGAGAKAIELKVEAAEWMPVLWADADRIEQVVTNLVGNAMKFTPPGGRITLKARWQPPEAGHGLGEPGNSPISSEGCIALSVSDTGIGIAENDIDRVFDKFYQADRSMTRSTGGTGLGLPICREIVMKHGGRIWVESRMNEGATFCCEIPVDSRTHDRAALQAAMERELGRSRRYGVPFSLLMVDIDNFSGVNEANGYEKGNTALLRCHEMVTEEVKQYLRERIRETDIVGRFGGDEFMVIAPETDEAGVRAFAERLRMLVERADFRVGDTAIRITVSIGVTWFTEEDQEPLRMVRRAVAALADAKSSGKNKVR